MNMITNDNGVAVFYATTEIKDFIRKILLDYYYDNNQLTDEFNFYDKGIIDSLNGIEILMQLEKEFNISFNESDEMKIIHQCSVNNIYLVLRQYITPSDI